MVVSKAGTMWKEENILVQAQHIIPLSLHVEKRAFGSTSGFFEVGPEFIQFWS